MQVLVDYETGHRTSAKWVEGGLMDAEEVGIRVDIDKLRQLAKG